MNDTTPAEIEQTDADEFAIATVGVSDASLSTTTVYVLPTSVDDAGVERNVNNCGTLFTVIVSVTVLDK